MSEQMCDKRGECFAYCTACGDEITVPKGQQSSAGVVSVAGLRRYLQRLCWSPEDIDLLLQHSDLRLVGPIEDKTS